AAPEALPVCGQLAAMVSIGDFADRAPRALADGENLQLGRHTIRWFDTPHMPHSWECGLMMDMSTRTFFCGDLFTQGGAGDVAVPDLDTLGRSEASPQPMDYFAHAPSDRGDPGAPGRRAPDDARLHARECLARRWRALVARARRPSQACELTA